MADSEFIIDIAAQFDSAAATGAQLDSLVDKLTAGGRKSEDFQAAVRKLTADLDAAKAASAQAAAALAAGADQYASLEKAAVSSAKALDRAQAKGQFDPRAARSAFEAQAALDAYTKTLRKLETESAAAKASQDGIAKSLAQVNKLGAAADQKIGSTNQRYEKLQAAVSRLPGPLGRVGGSLVGTAKAGEGLTAVFAEGELASLALAGGLAVVVAALVAVTAAAIAGYVAFGAYVTRQADAAREAALSREAFAALSAETAAGVASFDAITDATGQTDAQLTALTKQLRAAKVSAADMPKALRAAATAEAALGQGGASEFIDRIRSGELAVNDFAAEADAKFGGVVAKRLQGLAGLSARFSRLWSGLFKDVNLEPVLRALGVIVNMFDQANPLARALKGAIEGVFSTIADHALAAAYAVEAFALGFAIEMTKAYIAAKPFLRTLGVFTLNSDTAADAGKLLADTLLVLAVAFGTLALALLPIAVIVGAVVLVFGAVVAAVAAVGFAIGVAVAYIVDGVTAAYEFLNAQVQEFDDMGANLMQGLINGISGAVSSVVNAVTGAVGSAIDAAKSALGIASPSKVFAEIGDHTVAGFTGAVDDGAGDAAGSMASMVSSGVVAASSAATEAPAASGATGGGGRGAASFSFAGAVFNFSGVANAESARDLFSEAMTKLLEDDAASMAGAATT